MIQNLQTANVSITDEKQSKLGSGNFKGILVDVIKQGPIEIKINIDGKPITTQKQRFEITFPSQDTTRIHGGNFGESGNKFMQLYKGNANTIIIKDATGSNSIEVIYVTTKSDGTDWKKLDLVNNLTQIVLSINEPGPEDPIEPGPEDPA